MKSSYSRKIMLSFIGICLVIALVSGTVFYIMSKKMIADRHSLVVTDYINQSAAFADKQMNKVQEIADLLIFDDWFKYVLRQNYDDYGAYSAVTGQIIPKCQSAVKTYGDSMGVTLYVDNHTLTEHYYGSKNRVGIRYADSIRDDEVTARMRAEQKHILWVQTEEDKEHNQVSFYARIIDFDKLRELGFWSLR